MATVIIDLSISLDGFIAGPGDGTEDPLGRGGDALVDWMTAGPEANQLAPNLRPADPSLPVVQERLSRAGAVISGRRTFDLADGWADGQPLDVPIFVVTHEPPTDGRWSDRVTFVTDGVEVALGLARSAADGRGGTVSVSGASIAQQLLRAGSVDEIQVSIAPVLLGSGVRLFDHLGSWAIRLSPLRVVEGDGVAHLRYRVER